MANTEGYTFSNSDDSTGDRLNTTVRNAVIDLANNVSGLLDGSDIAPNTIPLSSIAPVWVSAGGTYNAVNGSHVIITSGDTLNLPSNPSNGDYVVFRQGGGDLSSSSATVSGGSKSISYNSFRSISSDATLTLNTNFLGEFKVTYNSGLGVWLF